MTLKKRQSKEKEATGDSPIRLKKEIGILQGVAIIVGVIVGSGIFVSPVGVLKYTNSVGLSFVIWVVTGIFSALGAIVYAELGVTIPRSGGEYIYILKAFGGLPAFMCLWINFFVVGAVSTAVNSRVFAEYVLRPIFPDCATPAIAMKLISLLGIMCLALVNCYSVKWATKVAVLFTFSKVSALLIIIGIGFFYLGSGLTGNFSEPFENSKYEIGPMALAIYQGFWAYAGWNYLNFLTEEMKNPARNLPIAIILSLSLVTVIYLLTNVAYLAVLSPAEMLLRGEGSAAVAVIFADRTMGVMSWIMPVFVGMSVFGSMNGEILSMSRLPFTGAQEGHMPSFLATVSYTYLTPMSSIVLLTTLACCFVMFEDVFYLIELVSFAFSVIAAMAVGSLLYLRYKQPNIPRPFKLPLAVPILFLILDVFIGGLTCYQQPTESMHSIALMISGVPVYAIGVMWRKKPKAFNNAIYQVTCFIQKLLLVVPEEDSSEKDAHEYQNGHAEVCVN